MIGKLEKKGIHIYSIHFLSMKTLLICMSFSLRSRTQVLLFHWLIQKQRQQEVINFAIDLNLFACSGKRVCMFLLICMSFSPSFSIGWNASALTGPGSILDDAKMMHIWRSTWNLRICTQKKKKYTYIYIYEENNGIVPYLSLNLN